MAFSVDNQSAVSKERKERAARRKKAREEGLFETLEGIEEYYLEVEGYTREEAEDLIIRECKRHNIEFENKSWVSKRADDAKVVINLIKENPEEVKLILPILTTAITSIASFAVGALSTNNSTGHHKYRGEIEDPMPQVEESNSQPIDRSQIERL